MYLKTFSCLLFLLTANVSFSQTSPFQNLLDDAQSKIRLGDYKSAIQDYDEILSIDSTQTDVLILKSKAQHWNGKSDQALITINKAIKIKPDADYLSFRGSMYLSLDKNQDAIQDLNEAIKTKPSAENYRLKGLAFMYDKRYDLAYKLLDSALVKDMRNTACYSSIIDLATKTDNEKLLKSTLAIAEVNVPYNMAHFNYSVSNFYEQNGNLEKAIEYAEKSSKLNRYTRLANLERKRGRDDKYLEYYLKHSAENEPKGNSATLNNIALGYRMIGQHQKALEYYEKALSLNKHNVFCEVGKSLIFNYQNDTASSVREINHAVSTHSKYAIAPLLRAFLHTTGGNYVQAEQDLILAAKTDSLPLALRRGESSQAEYIWQRWVYLNLRRAQYNEALININKALSFEKYQLGEHYNAKAYVFAKLGQVDSARIYDKLSFEKNQTPYYPFYNIKRTIDQQAKNNKEEFLAVQFAAPTADVNYLFESTFHIENNVSPFIKVRIIGPKAFNPEYLKVLNNGKALKKDLILEEKIEKASFLIENQPVTEYSFKLKPSSKTINLKFAYQEEESQTLIIKPE